MDNLEFIQGDGLDKNDARTQVYETLLEKITSGQWKPGRKIPSENQLTGELGVSRITVREALQKLVALNLIETQQGRGSFVKEFNSGDYFKTMLSVAKPGGKDILNLLEYRKILEAGTVRLAIERARPGDVELLKRYTVMMGDNLSDYNSYAYFDTMFHLKLAQMTQNPLISNACKAISELVEKSIRLTLSPVGAAEGVALHTKIVQAIAEKDTALGERSIREMLDSVIEQAVADIGAEDESER
ncbi:MAG: FadR family transcriptional regulator [Clostridiales bacterium]|nr:FadR family transcriptional regulator [Clostridiales bacterium]